MTNRKVRFLYLYMTLIYILCFAAKAQQQTCGREVDGHKENTPSHLPWYDSTIIIIFLANRTPLAKVLMFPLPTFFGLARMNPKFRFIGSTLPSRRSSDELQQKYSASICSVLGSGCIMVIYLSSSDNIGQTPYIWVSMWTLSCSCSLFLNLF